MICLNLDFVDSKIRGIGCSKAYAYPRWLSTKGVDISRANPPNHGIYEIQVQTFHREGLFRIRVARIAICPMFVRR